jgi:hypothetical protein
MIEVKTISTLWVVKFNVVKNYNGRPEEASPTEYQPR